MLKWFATVPGTGVRDDRGRRIRVCRGRDLPPGTPHWMRMEFQSLRSSVVRGKWLYVLVTPLAAIAILGVASVIAQTPFIWLDVAKTGITMFAVVAIIAFVHSVAMYHKRYGVKRTAASAGICVQCASELTEKMMESECWVVCAECGAAWRIAP